MNFSNVKSITIPQGKAVSVRADGAVLWRKSRLPIEYQEVEYLGADNGPHIDTSYIPVEGDEVYTEFMFTTVPQGSTYQALFSAGVGTYQFIFLCAVAKLANGAFWKYFASGTAANLSFNPAANTWYKLSVSADGLAQIGNYSEQSPYESALDGDKTTLRLLKRRNDASAFIGALKPFVVKNTGVEKLNLVPCYRKADNVPGMYDLVANAFYTNNGTGEFTIGPEV